MSSLISDQPVMPDGPPSLRTSGDEVVTMDRSPNQSAKMENRVRAVVIDSAGAVPRLDSVDLPRWTPGTTLVAVRAAPLNQLDLHIASGRFHSVRHEAPYVPGSECVGRVLESAHFPRGSWVYGECHASPSTPGAFAERVLISDEDVLALPEGVDPLLAAAVGNSGTAAFIPLIEDAGLRAGETVLVLGATGAVGKIAVQVARQCGAGRVVGVARNPLALARLVDLGAHGVVDVRPDESVQALADRLSAVAGQVDVVVDGLYGRPLEAALRVCAPRARVVNVGNLAGETAEIPAGLLRGKQLTLTGFAGLHTPLANKRAALNWLWNALGRGQLQVDVETLVLDQLPAAWPMQARSVNAKYVVLPDQNSTVPTPESPGPMTAPRSES